MNRRSFVKRSALGTLIVGTGNIAIDAMQAHDIQRVTIIHTNDVHSRVDPFPKDGGRNAGLGGASRRAAMIQRIRQEEKQVLLLDAGDIFQGTPYYNYFGGEIEMKLMSQMQYDGATIGNHDFDNGIEELAKQLNHASFPFIISNYDFSNTVMHDKHIPHKVFDKGGIKIGVTGVGIELDGLVANNLYLETQYNDPIVAANRTASHLKNELKCDYVICLSHLGYKYRSGDRVDDVAFASESSDIDLIIGGHTHTFMWESDIVKNKKGNPVLVNQAGWAGMMLGRVDLAFEWNKKNSCISCKNNYIS